MPKRVFLLLWPLDVGGPTFILPSRSYPPSSLRIPTAFCLSHSHALPFTVPLHHPSTVQAIPIVAIVILFVVVIMPVVLHSFLSCACRWHPMFDLPVCPWSSEYAYLSCVGDWPQCQCGGCWVGWGMAPVVGALAGGASCTSSP